MTRAEYARAVIFKSIKKRWSWLFGLPLLLFIVLMVMGQPLWLSVALAVVSHLALAIYTAVASYKRHRHEYPS